MSQEHVSSICGCRLFFQIIIPPNLQVIHNKAILLLIVQVGEILDEFSQQKHCKTFFTVSPGFAVVLGAYFLTTNVFCILDYHKRHNFRLQLSNVSRTYIFFKIEEICIILYIHTLAPLCFHCSVSARFVYLSTTTSRIIFSIRFFFRSGKFKIFSIFMNSLSQIFLNFCEQDVVIQLSMSFTSRIAFEIEISRLKFCKPSLTLANI